jgi:hypothetical protein
MKQVTITFTYSKEVDKEFNQRLVDLVSMDGVLYDIHRTVEDKTVIVVNNAYLVKEISQGKIN